MPNPLSNHRYFAPWTPITVAPMARGCRRGRGLGVVMTEVLQFAPLLSGRSGRGVAPRCDPSATLLPSGGTVSGQPLKGEAFRALALNAPRQGRAAKSSRLSRAVTIPVARPTPPP